jgi:hypothetical protein
MVLRILVTVFLAAAIHAVPVESAPQDSVGTASTGTARDSSYTLRYGVLYESRIDLERASSPFPWNDPEGESHLSDRLSLMTSIVLPRSFELFIKGATGTRAVDRPFYREQFALEQGHLSFGPMASGLEGRLFHRERIYRSGFLLLPLLTADRPFTSTRGGGLLVEVERGDVFGARYIESALRNDYRINDYGGLPLFSGGADQLRHLEAGIRGYHGLRLEIAVSQIRSIDYGDVVMLASGFGAELLDLRLDMELARSVEGDWEDVGRSRIFELDLDRFDMGDGSAVFGEHVAFSAEVEGLVYSSGSLGILHFVPGYRYIGKGFVNPAGEIAGPLVESYITAWWTHSELDLLVSLGARDRYELERGSDLRLLEGSARMRLEGGFTARGGVLYEIDCDPSLLLSLADENNSYRLVTSARIDDAGSDNHFSFLVDGALNLTGSVSVRSTLLLVRSAESLYNLGIEFRSSRKFLLNLGFGSFRPFDEEISFQYDELIESPMKDRFVTLSTRVSFGEL